MADWGWRVPFLLAAPMTLIGLYLRTRIDETPVFTALRERGDIVTAPLLTVVRGHWRAIVRALCTMGVNATGYYLVLGYMATYLETSVGLSAFQASLVMTISLLVYLPALFGCAWLADRIGRRAVLLLSAGLFLLLSYPIFVLLGLAGLAGALVLQLLLVTIFSLNDSTFATYFVESFPAEVRFSGFALPFNIGVALFGGTGPLVAAWLIDATGDNTMPAFVMMAVATLGLVAVLASRRTVAVEPAETTA